MDYTVHGILPARILEWVAFPFSRGSSQFWKIWIEPSQTWIELRSPELLWGNQKKKKMPPGLGWTQNVLHEAQGNYFKVALK